MLHKKIKINTSIARMGINVTLASLLYALRIWKDEWKNMYISYIFLYPPKIYAYTSVSAFIRKQRVMLTSTQNLREIS